jgi:hypothetical protein
VNTPGNPLYNSSLPTYTGGEALRNTAAFNANIPAGAPGYLTNYNAMLANGNYAGLANALNVAAIPGGQMGEYIQRNGFPVNFIKASPRLATRLCIRTRAMPTTIRSRRR